MEFGKAFQTRFIACALEQPKWYHVFQGEMFVSTNMCNNVATGSKTRFEESNKSVHSFIVICSAKVV